ncbi:hypothetical protein [Methylobacterium oryzihabitans]|uniref:DUF433 domain-containing protein n=1 Tax=Methylobacterium oryzihabitans TaxID=2499852 RepID=A0A3S2YWU5_9HYPH|nr:hypothetical protein [Methylobacterium oryzihabitans]RVU21178.1 hypothetical protein EOE48_03525 [Methylobacterium oryzihabitans]
MLHPGLLSSGIYTVPDAARLVEAEQNEMRVWIEGRKGAQDPMIENQLGKIGNKTAISFTNLMEVRFISLFIDAGVRLKAIRSIMNEAKNLLEHAHPFATNTVFKTDGRRVVAEIERLNEAVSIYDLKLKQYEMPEIVRNFLLKDVVFDPRGDAVSWKPRPKIAPNIIIHPAHSFGKPILLESLVPAETIAKAFKAEQDAEIVAEMFEIPEAHVIEAVRFHEALHGIE